MFKVNLKFEVLVLYCVKHGFVRIRDELIFSQLFSETPTALDVSGRLFCSIFICRSDSNVDKNFFAELTLLIIDCYD